MRTMFISLSKLCHCISSHLTSQLEEQEMQNNLFHQRVSPTATEQLSLGVIFSKGCGYL